jgi:hypothetical protein
MNTPAPNAALLALAGTWHGTGHGVYPTIEPFDYVETVTFTAPPKPFLVYQQTTKHAVTGLALHMESGFLRLIDGGPGIELVVAQPTGHAELAEGVLVTADGKLRLALEPATVVATRRALSVTGLHRIIEVTGDVLRYEVLMEAVGQPMQLHLTAELHRSA